MNGGINTRVTNAFSRKDKFMTTNTAFRGALALVGLYVAGPIAAQSLDYAALESLFGEPVTTSVTGSPQRASDVPATMQIITPEQIRRSAARDIPDVLSRLAGIDVRRTSSEHADVAVRGYNEAFSPRLLVLVDGRQVYADYYGFTPWSSVPIELDSIRQIEVVKGPAGALFGFNAVGGVVNIVTMDPQHDARDSVVTVNVGSQSLREVSAVSTLHASARTAVQVSAGSRRTDEFDGPRMPADTAVEQDNERSTLNLDAHFIVGDNSVLGIEATYSAADQIELPPAYSLSFGNYESSSFRTHWQSDTRLGLIEANLYRNAITNEVGSSGTGLPLEFGNDVLVAQLEDVFKVGTAHVVRLAGEYRENEMNTTPVQGGKVLFDLLSMTAMDDWALSPSLSFTNAVRIDAWELGREGYVPPGLVQIGVSNEDWDVSRDEVSFNSGLVWHTQSRGTVRLSMGRARQLPNLFMLGGLLINVFGDSYLSGSPSLDPANVSSVELAWSHGFDRAGLAFEASVFRGKTEDIYTLNGNIGDSRTYGIDVVLRGRMSDYLDWDVSLLDQDIDDEFLPGVTVGQSYVDYENTSPARTIKGHVGWSRGRLEIDGYARYVSESAGLRLLDPPSREVALASVPSHVAVDARVGYRVGERVRVALTGRNLTRSSQRQTAGLAVERQFYVTVQRTF